MIVGKSEQTDFQNRADNESDLKVIKMKNNECSDNPKPHIHMEKGYQKPITGGI